jgi:hypothetical protein
MKLATVLLLLSLSVPRIVVPPRLPVQTVPTQTARKGGRWYLAESGHAVYCYGPVRLLPQTQGGFLRVATFCQGERPMVPLKD